MCVQCVLKHSTTKAIIANESKQKQDNICYGYATIQSNPFGLPLSDYPFSFPVCLGSQIVDKRWEALGQLIMNFIFVMSSIQSLKSRQIAQAQAKNHSSSENGQIDREK
ncbi:hypothetical protein CCACVL1_05030 [Corchorus capsularis]|uniref:Uncharacterized protein n=1 Tax=Corchorus capsularis TaxID=210143 RepID=A0A1R3JMV4_COCAP|nr:hypothetical protein CCACVL1_05030 [Corchorus capsularis]